MPIPWQFLPVGPDCCSCQCCTHCTGTVPTCLTVALSGFAEGDKTYGCLDLNTTFDVECDGIQATYTLLDETELEDACRWSGGICGECESSVGWMGEVRVIYDGTDLYVEVAHCGDTATQRQGYLFKAASVSDNCAGWSAVALTLVGEYGEGGDGEGYWTCDGSGASATVTAKASACTPHPDCDCQPDCPECMGLCEFSTPCCIQATLSGFADTYDPEFETGCDYTPLNGTHKLAGPFAYGGEGPFSIEDYTYACKWTKCLSTPVCGYDRISLLYWAYTAGGTVWDFAVALMVWDSTGTESPVQFARDWDIDTDVDPWPDCWEELTNGEGVLVASGGNPPVGDEAAQTVPLDDECDCGGGCLTDCGNCDDPIGATVDLGVGGWVDSGCGECDEIAGEFALSPTGPFGASWPCFWEYLDDSGGCRVHLLFYYLVINASEGYFVGSVYVGPKYGGTSGSRAYYGSGGPGGACLTLLDENDSVTLTKGTETLGTACTGSLPATITLTLLW